MNFRTHARAQALACADLGSPLTARLLTLVADRLVPGTDLADHLLDWPAERLHPDAVGLRLAGALHYLVLTGQAPILKRLYADTTVPDTQFWRAIESTLKFRSAEILPILAQAPQTNEVRRSSALIAAAHWLTAAYGLPLVLSELGSSVGLNLLWDHYALEIAGRRYGPEDPVLTLTPDWKGAAPPEAAPLIRSRAGVDLNPLDPEHDQMRLLSYIWADQPDRLARARAALALACEKRPEVARGNAIDWLEGRLSRPVPQAVHLVCHTITWQYLSNADQARGLALLQRVGQRCRADEPLSHLSMEQDGAGPGAALVLHLWPADERIELGRADFHGRWVDWRAPAM